MITARDIVNVYDIFKKNIKIEEDKERSLYNAEDTEVWIDILRQKSWALRELMRKNTELIGQYIQPLMSGRETLTPETAAELANQVFVFIDEGYHDFLLGFEMGKLVEQYYTRNYDAGILIRIWSVLGTEYHNMENPEYAVRSVEYYHKVIEYADRYFEFKDWVVRKRILLSFYNYTMVKEHWTHTDCDTLEKEINQALEFWSRPDVVALDGDKYNLKELADELKYDMYNNKITRDSDNEEEFIRTNQHFIESGISTIKELYNERCEKIGNPLEMEEEIYITYYHCLFYHGEITRDEYYNKYYEYVDYVCTYDELKDTEELRYYDSNFFTVSMHHVPFIINICYSPQWHRDDKTAIAQKMFQNVLDFVRALPHTYDDAFVNGDLSLLLENLTTIKEMSEILNFRTVMEITINREPSTAIHANMVRRIALRLFSEIYHTKPELLIGCLNTGSLIEVIEHITEFENYLSEGALIHDIGKIEISDIINRQTRMITDFEWKIIKNHPQAGVKMAGQSEYLKRYIPVILGHHKDYNGKGGYPEDYNNVKADNRFLVDIIRIADCLDAATDMIGRNYTEGKSFEEVVTEFVAGRGTKYNPDIVDIITGNDKLKEELTQILTDGREQTYFDIYHRYFIEGKERELMQQQKEQADGATLLKVFGQLSILLGIIDIHKDDEIRIIKDMSAKGAANTVMKYTDFINRAIIPYVYPGDREYVSRALELILIVHNLESGQPVYQSEFRIKLDNTKEYTWVRVNYLPADSTNGDIVQLAVYMEDINSYKQAQEETRQILVEAYKTANSANAAKSDFLSNMSHDIRTPMNAIIGMTRIAQENLADQNKVSDCLREIMTASEHLLELINEVLDVSRIDSGRMELTAKKTTLSQILEPVRTIIQGQADERNHSFICDFGGVENDCVYTDDIRLKQILLNLLSNAVKYTENGGNIEFYVSRGQHIGSSSNYIFIIRDNGIGMSEEFMTHLYEPFARENSRLVAEQQGTGLGLRIVKNIVDMMGGHINIQSQQNEGTTFVVTLPMQPATADNEQREVGYSRPQTRRTDFTGCNILLVEDNAINMAIAKNLITKSGAKVWEAHNGLEAIDSINSHPDGFYDMVFMDIRMPVMDGYEATSQIRQLGSTYAKVLPIVAMTANAFAEDVQKAMEAGMNEHVVKPIDPKIVMEVMERFCR